MKKEIYTMKNLSWLGLLAIALVCSFPAAQPKSKPKALPCPQGTSYRGCPACGIARNPKQQTLNIQKNRGKAVTNPEKITVQEIRDPANNTGKFTPSKQVWVTGFVATVFLNIERLLFWITCDSASRAASI